MSLRLRSWVAPIVAVSLCSAAAAQTTSESSASGAHPPAASTPAFKDDVTSTAAAQSTGPDGQRSSGSEATPSDGIASGASAKGEYVTKVRDVQVNGAKLRGAVIGDIPPQRTLSPVDIRSYGSNDVGELLQTISAQVTSIRGREDDGPVVLLNGRRISGVAEISKVPTEAIERVEIFPEEVALKYGFRADQKVVNIVLFRRFSSRIGQVGLGAPTEGGRDTADTSGSFFRLRGNTRLSLDGSLDRAGYLLESDRGVHEATDDTSLGAARTLLPRTERASVSGVVAGSLLNKVTSSLNAGFEADDSVSFIGPGIDGPTRREVRTYSTHVGTTSGGFAGRWPWTLTGNYDRVLTSIDTEGAVQSDPAGAARSINSSADADVESSGSLVRLPTGSLSATLRAGLAIRDYASSALDAGEDGSTRLSRRSASVEANLDLPILRKRESPGWVGGLSANLNARVEATSDFGSLHVIGYGLAWSPNRSVSLIASVTDEQGAPTVEQLGAARVSTPDYPTFDFVRGEFAAVTRTFGGNPGLRHDERRLLKIGLNARPLAGTDLLISATFVGTRIADPIVNLPDASPGIEAAFPGRFGRSPSGRLGTVDASPVNFDESRQEVIRWGLDLTKPLGRVPPEARGASVRYAPSDADIQGALPPKARVEKVPSGSPAAKQIENLSSRLTVSLYHSWYLQDEVVPRAGASVLDLLNGAALDARGGRSRHEVQLQVGTFKHGLGVRVSADWRSATRVRVPVAGSDGVSDGLRFSSYETLDLNLFANLGALSLARRAHWLQGMRVTAAVSNLLDHRVRVTDATGTVPLNYQSAYIDPLGRVASVTLRKLF